MNAASRPSVLHATPDHLEAQAVGGGIAALNAARLEALQDALTNQDVRLREALGEMQHVRDFIGAPSTIIGNPSTKHGEIAEELEVAVRRAKDALNGQEPSAFMAPDRTAPEDYFVGGFEVQSKFINGENNGLQHVLDHLAKYDFAKDGGYYHIPAGQHETILEALQTGEGNRYAGDLHGRTLNTIRKKVAAIEQETGRRFEDVVRPSDADYSEVQQGAIHDTVEQREEGLREKSSRQKEAIRDESGPSMKEGALAVAGAAAAGAAVRGLPVVIEKWRQEGKNPFQGDYGAEDWKELGLEAGRGAAAGGLTGGAIYAMTNCTALSAPLAGTVASAGRGVARLAQSYQAGEITESEFAEESQILCSEAALVGVGTALGQTIVPIPVLGALIGSGASQLALHFAKGALDEKDAQFAKVLEDHYEQSIARLDAAHRQVLEALEDEVAETGQLMEIAFDLSLNARTLLDASTVLAETSGVAESRILRSTSDVDAFMQPETVVNATV